DTQQVADRNEDQGQSNHAPPVESVREECHQHRGRGDSPDLDRGGIPCAAVIETQMFHETLDEPGLYDEYLRPDDTDQYRRDQPAAGIRGDFRSTHESTRDIHHLNGRVLLEAIDIEFDTDTRALDAPERRHRVQGAVLVHPRRPAIQSAGVAGGLIG